MTAVQRILIIIVTLYCAWIALCFLFQKSLIYPGSRISAPPAPRLPPGAELLRITTPEGSAEAWYFLPRGGSPPYPAVLYFHGNGEVIDFLPREAELFLSLGAAVLLVEYPGYGRSDGTPSERGIMAGALAAYDLLKTRREIDGGKMVAFGRSLGGGAACGLAAKRELAAVILQSPFTSLRPLAWRLLVPPLLLRDTFDNVAALRNFQGGVLVFHGRHDRVIPYPHGERVAKAAAKGTFVPLECDHNDCPPDTAEFVRRVKEFLQRNGALPEKG